MKLFKSALLVLSVAGASYAQPVIKSGGIVNAASWAIAGLPNANIAQGSIFIIAGSNLGPTTLTQAPNSYPLQKAVGGVTVKVSMNGTDTQAIIFWVRNDYIAALLPSTVPVGTGTVTVTFNGQDSNAAPITVVANSVGIFSIAQNGQGPGVITDANKPQTSVQTMVVTQTNSAKPDDIVNLWVTGVGAVPFDETQAPPSTPTNLQPTLHAVVYVGTTAVTPSFAGPSGCCEGEGQIQFKIPAGVTGCYVPVSVVTGNQTSNVVTMAIDTTGQTCSDPFGLSKDQLTILQTTGTLRLGNLSLSRSSINFPGATIPPTDAASGSFQSFSASTFSSVAGARPSLNTCVINQFTGGTGSTGGTITGLDAGQTISLTGPGGNASLTENAQAKGLYSSTLPPGYLDATSGNFVFTGTGGADVKAFTATLPASPVFTWSNEASITTVDRTQSLPINWTGGDASGFVMIFGSASASSGGPGESFTCIAPNAPHTFSVPAWVLLSLPATSSSDGTLAVFSFSQPRPFTAAGIDAGSVSESSLAFTTVTYQ